MTPLRQRMTEDLTLLNRSPRTIKTYISHVAAFARYFGRSPELLGAEEIRRYQLHLIQEKHSGWSNFNQAVCALRFLYGNTLKCTWPVVMIPFGKRPRKLPVVLGPDEVQKLLACTSRLTLRVLLTTLYAAGLRINEALQLTVPDIDSARMMLRVRRGKGNKERLVPLSPRLLEELRGHYRRTRPQRWLFPGAKPDQPLNPGTVQKACQAAARRAALSKHVTPHVLRHSYATGLLEAGVDLLTIQQLLGHSSLSTTLVYLHVRRPHLESIISPLDLLPVSQLPRVTLPDSTPLR